MKSLGITVVLVLAMAFTMYSAAVWSQSAGGIAASEPATAATTTSVPATQVTTKPADPEKLRALIKDLSSDDGKTRMAATQQLFLLGEQASAALKEAGACQLTPWATELKTDVRRMDLVYSLIAGLLQNATKGYRTDAILLHVDNTCSTDDVTAMGKRCGFTLKKGATVNDGWIAVLPADANKFAQMLKDTLTGEPKVINISLLYFSKIPMP